jgi:hypothetical protein
MMSWRKGVLLAGLLMANAAVADDRLALAGGEAGNGTYYTYAGVVLPGPGREAGRGLLQRYWIDAFGYEYDGAPGRVKARAYGAEAALGYGRPFTGGWASTYLGLRYTDTDLSPDDPSAEARGSQVGVKLDIQGEYEILPGWRGNAIASYTSTQRAYWSRVRLMRALSGRQALGGEVVAGGNDESQATSFGLVLSFQPGSAPWSTSLKAGYRHESDDDGAYAGIELGYAF